MRTIPFLCLIILLGVTLTTAAGPARAAAPPRVDALVLTGDHFKLDADIQKRLEQEGIRCVVRKLSDPLSLEAIKLFDLVVLADFEGLATPYFVPTDLLRRYLDAKRNVALLQEYVASGGGVFFSPLMAGGGPEVAEGCAVLLEPWEAGILAAQVRDDAHAGLRPNEKAEPEYSWTTNIQRSPVSDGVKRLWYPTNMLRWDDAYATVPLALHGQAWQVVARGMPEGVAAHGLQYTEWLPIPDQKAPVIAAVRTVNQGRVALLGVSPFYTLWLPNARPANGWYGESKVGQIDGIFLENGDGETPSDGWRLLLNMVRWLAEGSRAAGLGGYTDEKFAAAPKPEPAPIPAWLRGWRAESGAAPFKVLLGGRSEFSDGQGTVAEFADAARRAGYSILVMTETFERFDGKRWGEFVAACRAEISDELVVLPGIDIADVYQNRYLLFGQTVFPSAFMLTEDGRALRQTQYLSLGFGTHFTAIHRPTTTPLPHHLHKFFAGYVVFTYRDGKLVDDSRLPYRWQVNNESVPVPLVVHEVYSPAQVASAAAGGHQQYVLADTVANAAWYLRAGMAHFWETPSLLLVSAGPMIQTLSWGEIAATGGALIKPPPPGEGQIAATNQVPIAEITLWSNTNLERRWRPGTNDVRITFNLPNSHLRWALVEVTDAEGRTAITPALRAGPSAYYAWRCSDRQNFFGYAAQYQGAVLPDFDIRVPAFGTDEGKGIWPHGSGPRQGENLAPLFDFPYASPAVTITDAHLDQRYWRALWEDVVFDAKASQGTSRARVFEAHARYYDFNLAEEYRKTDNRRPLMLKEITIRLRAPVLPSGPVFPGITQVARGAEYGYVDPRNGQEVGGKLEKGFVDLPVGGFVGDLIALSPLRVSADGQVGFAAPAWANGPLPVGTEWTGRYVKVPSVEQLDELRAAMGVAGRAPFALEITRGEIQQHAYVAWWEAKDFGVAGAVVTPAANMPFALPVCIAGVNANWQSGVWREDGSLESFGVFEGRGWARLDVTKAGQFYAGNLVTAGNPSLRLTVLQWEENRLRLEAHNPTDADIECAVTTPEEIKGKFPLRGTVKVPAGGSVIEEFK